MENFLIALKKQYFFNSFFFYFSFLKQSCAEESKNKFFPSTTWFGKQFSFFIYVIICIYTYIEVKKKIKSETKRWFEEKILFPFENLIEVEA